MATQAGHSIREPAQSSRATSTLVLLLTLAIFINALDRGNFSTDAPLNKDQLHLTNSQIEGLRSAFV